MKATTLLRKQHSQVKALFKKLEGGKGDQEALRAELADNLCAHMAIEQDIFYPAVRSLKEDLVLESFEEHAIAELSLKRLMATETSAAIFDARVTTLKELINHHVKEEEEDLFPKVERSIGASDLDAMGKQMKAAFADAMAKGHKKPLFGGDFAATTSDAARQRGSAATPTPPKTKTPGAKRAPAKKKTGSSKR